MKLSKETVIIPTALQLCLDDVGWHDGRDLRTIGQPSRSGLPRNHAPEDYKMLAELGRAVDMKILCPLCLGDWDKDNFLRGEVGVSHKPYDWDRASEIDLEYTNKCFYELESAEYIEYAIHGLMHGRYSEKGELIWEREYFIPVDETQKTSRLDLDDFKHRLDLFFKIFNSWGFSKSIRSFVAPCSMQTTSVEIMETMAEELTARGVKYWANGGFPFKEHFRRFSDIICMRKMGNVPWEAYDFDPKYFEPFGANSTDIRSNIIGMHWTNFLHYNPENNLDRLDAWVDFFKRQSEIFGAMLSKDIAFSANQQFYRMHSNISIEDNKCVINLADVEEKKNVKGNNVFYISFKNGVEPVSCENGTIKLYETHNEFKTYEIRHSENTITLTF